MAETMQKIISVSLQADQAIRGIQTLNQGIEKNNSVVEQNKAEIKALNKAMEQEGADAQALKNRISDLENENEAYNNSTKELQVRLWKLDKDTDSNKYKATWADGGDYLVGYDSDANVVRNTGQDFKRTIANYYAPYVEVTNRPKVIEAVVRMPILDLMAFDFERTAYINQLGRKYFVINIDSEGNDKYTLELLQV